MAFQIYDKPSLGTQFGQGIGQGLQSLANLKLNQLAERNALLKTQQAYEQMNLPGSLAFLPQGPQAQLAKLYQQQPNNQLMAEISGLLYGGQSPQQDSNQLLNTLTQQQPQQPNQPMNTLGMLLGQPGSMQGLEDSVARAAMPQGQQGPREMMQQPTAQQPALSDNERQRQVLSKVLQLPLNSQQRKEYTDRYNELEKQSFQEKILDKKLSAQNQRDVNKETLSSFNEISKQYKAAKDGDRRLEDMTKLIQRGNLPNPTLASAVKTLSHGVFGFGIDLTNLLGADAETFEKLSSDFVKNAKDFFGSRVTDTDLKLFMKTLPSLIQSNEGKARLVNSLKSVNQIAKIRYETMKDIIKENSGKRPENLELLIDERAEPALDKAAEEFKNSYENIKVAPAPGIIGSLGKVASDLLIPEIPSSSSSEKIDREARRLLNGWNYYQK